MKTPLRIFALALIGLFTFVTAMPVMADHHKKSAKNIAETASEAGQFKTLLAAAQAAGLVPALTGDDKLTVFAPTDAAFAALPEGTVEALLKPENKDKLKSILLYHVVPGKVKAADAVKVDSVKTLFGQSASISVNNGKAMIDGANIVATDIMASNGVIHVIDAVIMPRDIVGVAVTNGSFDTLVAAVKAAELVEVLQGDGPFTVFAPTDAAFGKLPAGTVETLVKPENKNKLQSILTYHVVPGKLTAADVVGKTSIKTVQGASLTVKVVKDSKGNDVVMIDGARVIATDVPALNGVIHVIDAVVLPKAPASASTTDCGSCKG